MITNCIGFEPFFLIINMDNVPLILFLHFSLYIKI